jgi:hypothetical protein
VLVQGIAATNSRRSAWQRSWIALRPDIAQTGTIPPGSTHCPHMMKSAKRGNVLDVPMIFSGIVLNEGDDVEIAGVSNARNQWLEAARVHHHTTGATWELNLWRVAAVGYLPVALALLSLTAVLALSMAVMEIHSMPLRPITQIITGIAFFPHPNPSLHDSPPHQKPLQ